MEQTYLYEVRPHKIITGIHGVPYIRTPRAVYLTKDEVLICLQKGSVYRRFANLDKLERVTVTNVDRLHNEKFISEEEWIGTKKEDTPVAPPVEPKQEEPKKEETQPLEQAAKEDNGVVDRADEAASTETEKEAPVEESSETVEESSDDSEATDGEEEKVDEAEPQQQNNIQFKNHHNNKKHNKK